VDNNDETVAASGGGGRQKGGFDGSSRRTADWGGDDEIGEDPRRQSPTALMRWWGVVIDKLIPSLFSVDIIFSPLLRANIVTLHGVSQSLLFFWR
jgi:hypothetical protein